MVSLAHSENFANTSLHGKCNYSIFEGVMHGLYCSSYTEIPTDIVNPEIMWYLHMNKGNNISTLANGSLIRSNLKSLRMLDLKNCKIRVIELGAFAGSKELVYILLTNNLITVLNLDIFADVANLKNLYVDTNPIEIIEAGKIFPNLTKLVHLDLSNCRLNNISVKVFTNLKNLQELNLSGNNLERLDWRVFQRKTIIFWI